MTPPPPKKKVCKYASGLVTRMGKVENALRDIVKWAMCIL